MTFLAFLFANVAPDDVAPVETKDEPVSGNEDSEHKGDNVRVDVVVVAGCGREGIHAKVRCEAPGCFGRPAAAAVANPPFCPRICHLAAATATRICTPAHTVIIPEPSFPRSAKAGNSPFRK